MAVDLSLALPAAALVVGLTVLATRRWHVSSFASALVLIAEIAVIIASVVTLGWWGLGVGGAVVAAAASVYSVRLAAKYEKSLVSAIARGRLEMDKKGVKKFARRLRREDRAMRSLRPLAGAELIRILSELGRSEQEIKCMAPTVARLWQIYDVDDPEEHARIANKFDRLLRLWGRSAEEAERTADVLVAGSKSSPATWEELLDAMIAVVDPLVEDDAGQDAAGLRGAPAWRNNEGDTRPTSSGQGGESPDSTDHVTDAADTSLLEEARASAEVQIHASGKKGVRLHGGPMDGWLVLPDAEVLEPDWYRTWPASVASRFAPGRYVLGESGKWADWEDLA